MEAARPQPPHENRRMETVVQPPADDGLQLLTQWGDPARASRTRKAAVLSLLVHAAVFAAFWMMPEGLLDTPERLEVRRVTPLVEPRLTALTQTAPNQGEVPKQFNGGEGPPRPRIHVPQGMPAPPAPKEQPRRRAEIPPPPLPKPVRLLPEPPKVEIQSPRLTLPPPEILTEDNSRPKPATEAILENVGPSTPPLPPERRQRAPDPADVLRHPMGVPLPDDPGALPRGGAGADVNLPQLLSDPQGVDFRPYLKLVLDSVRRHWTAVMPESVRMGTRGNVSVVFSISREGGVPRLVVATSSGNRALDFAAVAGVVASRPFPPLPRQFRGLEIRVQLNFTYNAPR